LYLAVAQLGLLGLPVPAEVIAVAVRWYLRYGLSYRDVEEPAGILVVQRRHLGCG
jgi:hypothetical protein